SRPVDDSTALTVGDASAPRTWSAPASAVATGTTRVQAPVAAVRAVGTTVTHAAASAAAAQAASGGEGCTWEVSSASDGNVQLSTRQGRSQNGHNVPLSSLEGLAAAQLSG